MAIHPVNVLLTREKPDIIAGAENIKAIFYSTLEKVCWIALIVFAGTAFMTVYGGVVLSTTASTLLSLSTLTALFGVGPFRTWAAEHKENAELEHAVAEELKEIEKWTDQEINTFLDGEEIPRNEECIHTLKQLNPKRPLKALFPLIARFKFLREKGLTLEAKAQKNLQRQDFGQIEHLDILRNDIAFEKNLGWNIHEKEVFPILFKAAILLEIMKRPFVEELSLEKHVGRFTYNTLGNRLISQKYGPRDETCFEFHPDVRRNDRQNLTLEMIEANLEPRNLRRLLFEANPA